MTKVEVSRNTVKKYINEFEESIKNVRNLLITEEILKEPTYKENKRRILTGEVIKIIRGYINSVCQHSCRI